MSKDGGLFGFDVDLTSTNELPRVAAVLEAIGDAWDPVEVAASESAARRRLYSGLDAKQQVLYDMLVAEGVLPAL